MLDQKTFGEKLRNHRKKLGMTQEGVAAPEVLQAICTEEGQKLILTLSTERPTPKQDLIDRTGIPLPRLNELLLLLTENNVIEFYADHHAKSGYMISGHCGIAAYMLLAAMYILDKKRNYGVSQYLSWYD